MPCGGSLPGHLWSDAGSVGQSTSEQETGRVYRWRRIVSSLSYPCSHDIDTQAELNDERYARALKALSPSDVLATVDDLVAQIPNAHAHPLYALVAHCLQYGTTKSSGRRPYVSEMVGASYELLIDAAITRLVEERLADFSAWED
jgi:hypothetical protein